MPNCHSLFFYILLLLSSSQPLTLSLSQKVSPFFCLLSITSVAEGRCTDSQTLSLKPWRILIGIFMLWSEAAPPLPPHPPQPQPPSTATATETALRVVIDQIIILNILAFLVLAVSKLAIFSLIQIPLKQEMLLENWMSFTSHFSPKLSPSFILHKPAHLSLRFLRLPVLTRIYKPSQNNSKKSHSLSSLLPVL